MNKVLIINILVFAIPVITGIYACLYGYRLIGQQEGKDEEYDNWFERHALSLRTIGCILIVYSVITGVNSHATGLVDDWVMVRQCVERGEGNLYTILMPGRAKYSVPKDKTGFGTFVSGENILINREIREFFYIKHTELDGKILTEQTPEALFQDQIDRNLRGGYKNAEKSEITFRDLKGWEILYDGKNGSRLKARQFLVGKYQFEVSALVPEGKTFEDADRYLNSFRPK